MGWNLNVNILRYRKVATKFNTTFKAAKIAVFNESTCTLTVFSESTLGVQ